LDYGEHIVDIITGQSIRKYSTYIGMGKTDGYRYSFRVYSGHMNIVQLILEFLPGGHQVFPWGVLAPPTPLFSCRVCRKPLDLFLWSRRHPIPVRAYTKSFRHI